MPYPATLDHLVVTVPDLDAAIAWFAEATGVAPVPSGRHPDRGTANALVVLDAPGAPAAYLELLGPDPLQDPEVLRRADATLVAGAAPALRTWAVHPDDLDGVVERAQQAGVRAGTPFAMSRATPAGDELHWRVSRAPGALDGVQPFLIDWGTTPHPSTADLPTLTLEHFEIAHPDAAGAALALAQLGSPVEVTEGPALLTATLRGPAGTLTVASTDA